MLDIVGVLLLPILGGLAAFILVASRLMIALLIGIAPVMIFLTIFEVTKDYFARWLSALVSFALYPIVVAGVFATITGVSSALIGELGDPEGASNIGAPIPFFMMVLMANAVDLAQGRALALEGQQACRHEEIDPAFQKPLHPVVVAL